MGGGAAAASSHGGRRRGDKAQWVGVSISMDVNGGEHKGFGGENDDNEGIGGEELFFFLQIYNLI